MLVLNRKRNQRIIIGDITIALIEIRGDSVKIGIDAPKHVTILREEVRDRNKQQEERERGSE